MRALLRTIRAPRDTDGLLGIVAISLTVFGLISFGITGGSSAAVWTFRVIVFGLAGAAFMANRGAHGARETEPLRFEGGALVIARRRIDPLALTAASVSFRGQGGIVHLWEGEAEMIITADADVFAIVRGALRPALLDAPRTYLPSGPIQSLAKLFVDHAGLGFAAGWMRGQGMTRIDRIEWSDVKRVYVQDGYLIIQRTTDELVGPGVSFAADLEQVMCEEIEAMRSPVAEDPVPDEVLTALPRLAAASDAREGSAPYREAPNVDVPGLRAALARGPIESRLLAADVLVARGAIPQGAAAFIRRGLGAER